MDFLKFWKQRIFAKVSLQKFPILTIIKWKANGGDRFIKDWKISAGRGFQNIWHEVAEQREKHPKEFRLQKKWSMPFKMQELNKLQPWQILTCLQIFLKKKL